MILYVVRKYVKWEKDETVAVCLTERKAVLIAAQLAASGGYLDVEDGNHLLCFQSELCDDTFILVDAIESDRVYDLSFDPQ